MTPDEQPPEKHHAAEAHVAPDQQPPLEQPGHEFLVPGPTPESNEGLGRWGLSWLIFSLALIIMMALISYVCWVLARWTGLA